MRPELMSSAVTRPWRPPVSGSEPGPHPARGTGPGCTPSWALVAGAAATTATATAIVTATASEASADRARLEPWGAVMSAPRPHGGRADNGALLFGRRRPG